MTKAGLQNARLIETNVGETEITINYNKRSDVFKYIFLNVCSRKYEVIINRFLALRLHRVFLETEQQTLCPYLYYLHRESPIDCGIVNWVLWSSLENRRWYNRWDNSKQMFDTASSTRIID